MTSKDKLAVSILIGLLGMLAIVLVWTFKPPTGTAKSPAESALVKQRIINLQKAK